MSGSRPLAVGVVGASGRMGCRVIRSLRAEPGRFRLAGAWARAKSPALGRDAGEWAGGSPLGVTIAALEGGAVDGCAVVVDFSCPTATASAARLAAQAGVAFVTGTTGLDSAADAALAAAARRVAVLAAANFAPGIAVLAELVRLARARLGRGFDVEIFELHHRGKRDAPSGTARWLGAAAGDDAVSVRADARHGDGEVGYAVARGGGAIGEHTVFFLGEHERLELTHRAQDRELFASGAVTAAEWLAVQSPGRYSVSDFLKGRSSGD